jgi:CYTH domain-containing protein
MTRTGSSLPREIERRYLLARAPVVPAGTVSEELWIEQGWLPGERLRHRLRRVRDAHGERFEHALKLGQGLERIEIEEHLSRADFERLWPATAGCRIAKVRTRVRVGAHGWELDRFLDRALWLAEVELADPDEAVALPPWLQACLVREVTEEPGYTNLALARSGAAGPG